MVHRLAPAPGAFDEDAEIVLRRRLSDEFRQRLGPQRDIDILDLTLGGKQGVIGHEFTDAELILFA
jgi:hypothetical protein